MVFGSVQMEGFDPLSFSKSVGDYPKHGADTGARWRSTDHELAEREVVVKKKDHRKKWYKKY